MTARPLRRAAGLMVLVIAGLASLATSPGPAPTQGVVDITAELTSTNPVAARQIDVVVAANGGSVQQPTLEAWGADYLGGASGYSLSIIPSDLSEPRRPREADFFGFFPDVSQDLAPYCAQGCSRSYIVIMRSESSLDVDAIAHVYAWVGSGTSSPTATVTLSDQQFPNGVSAVSAELSGQLDADLFGSGSWHGTIKIPAAAYDALSGPVYGSIAVSGSSKIGDYGGAQVRLSINGVSEIGATLGEASDPFSFERGWLSACTPGADCEVPVDVDLLWTPFDFFGVWPFTPGHAHVNYTVEARLEYLDRTDLPPGATLEITAR